MGCFASKPAAVPEQKQPATEEAAREEVRKEVDAIERNLKERAAKGDPTAADLLRDTQQQASRLRRGAVGLACMSNFVVTGQGVVLNKTAAADGRVPVGAWELELSSFLSTQAPAGGAAGPSDDPAGRWEVAGGAGANEILISAEGREIGRVNSRAAAILGPLLAARLIDLEIQQNQQAGRALYIYANLGAGGNAQVVREPQTTEQMRAYVALLACSMQALKDVSRDRSSDGPEAGAAEASCSGEAAGPDPPAAGEAATWRKLPGTLQWDSATGSVGNTVNLDLIDLLGSRTLAALRDSGAPRVRDQPG